MTSLMRTLEAGDEERSPSASPACFDVKIVFLMMFACMNIFMSITISAAFIIIIEFV